MYDTIENIAHKTFQLPISTRLRLAAREIFQDFRVWLAQILASRKSAHSNKHKTNRLNHIVLKLVDLYLWAMRSLKITLKMLSNGRIYPLLVNEISTWFQEILQLLAFMPKYLKVSDQIKRLNIYRVKELASMYPETARNPIASLGDKNYGF